MPYFHTCPQCGIVYPAARKKQKFCSYACSNKSAPRKHTPRITKDCQHCSVKFESFPKENRKYCSDTCARIGRSLKTEVSCHVCGKTKMVSPSAAGLLYCSNKCYGKTTLKPTINICKNCGKETIHSPLKAKLMIYCSRRCYQKFRGETVPEQLTREALQVLGVAFDPQYTVSRYNVDFYIASLNIALEVDGIYWHEKQKEQDAKRDAYLSQQSIKTVRVTDREIATAPCLPTLIAKRLGIKWSGQISLPF